MTSGIYSIHCIGTDKYYVGQSIEIENRWKNHLATLKAGKHRNEKLQADFNELGIDAFEFKIEHECREREDLLYFESYFAELLDVFNKGYNIGRLHNCRDIAYVRFIFNYVRAGFLKTLENHTKDLEEKEDKTIEDWEVLVNPKDIEKAYNLTNDQLKIFLILFKEQGYLCNVLGSGEVLIKYVNVEYKQRNTEDFYL